MASPNGQLAMKTIAVKGIQSNRNRRSATARFNRYMLVTHCNATKNVIVINLLNKYLIKFSKRIVVKGNQIKMNKRLATARFKKYIFVTH